MKEIKSLNKEVRKMAVSSGLCQQWQREWESDWDAEKLVSRFYKGIDFYIDKRFVTKEYIKESLDDDFRRKNGMIVDDEYSLMNPENVVLIGNSSATIRMNGFKLSTAYVTDLGTLKVVAKNRSFVMVHAYDYAKIQASAYDSASIVVVRHSENAEVTSSGNVKVKDEINP